MHSSLKNNSLKSNQKTSRKIAAALSNYGPSMLVALLIGLFIFLRLFTFGELRLSIGVVDTPTYLEAAEQKVTLHDAFTRQRLLTTIILYRATLPAEGYELIVINSPAFRDQNPFRQIQPGFEATVLTQIFISIISWATLALVFVNRLRQPIIKIVSLGFILLFSLVPQISDWDSILASESLSISLFALSFALIIEFIFRFLRFDEQSASKKWRLVIPLFFLIVFFFTFTRDSNLYVILSTLILLIPLLLIRSRKLAGYLVGVFLIVVFLLGYLTSQQSGRWKIPLAHVFTDRIQPYPLRVEFMQSHGMPDPSTAQYVSWFNENAPGTYFKFLIHHPGYSLLSLMENMEIFFSENLQPYFVEPKDTARKYYLLIGDFFHPTTSAVFLLDILLLGVLWYSYILQKTPERLSWAWLGSWLFFSASVTLFLSYHSDSIGIIRHALSSVIYYRLFLWLFLFVLSDQLITSQKALKASIKNPEKGT